MDERAELASIAASLRAYLELQWDAGSTGIPRAAKRPVIAAPPPPSAVIESAPVSLEPATVPIPISESAVVTLRALPLIEEQVASCTKCELAKTRTKTVFSRGNPKAALCFVGEAPGAEEDASGVPFVGKAGQLLDRMIKAMGLSPEKDVYICNIIKCRPPGNRKPTTEESRACVPYLHEQLANVAPRVIVALGNTSVQTLLDTKLGVTRLRGEWKLYRGKTLVMPTYHPSYLLRESPLQRLGKQEAWEDLQKVMKELGLSVPSKPPSSASEVTPSVAFPPSPASAMPATKKSPE